MSDYELLATFKQALSVLETSGRWEEAVNREGESQRKFLGLVWGVAAKLARESAGHQQSEETG